MRIFRISSLLSTPLYMAWGLFLCASTVSGQGERETFKRTGDTPLQLQRADFANPAENQPKNSTRWETTQPVRKQQDPRLTPQQQMPFGPATGLPFNSNRTARQPATRIASFRPTPKFPANAKSVKQLYRADYDVDEATASILEKLLTERSGEKVEAKVISDSNGKSLLRITTDEKSQQAIANFIAQVFPEPTSAKTVMKRKSAETSVKTFKLISIKTPKMKCRGCANSVTSTLAGAKCKDIKCDTANKTCTFHVEKGVDEAELLNDLAQKNQVLENWELLK
jgi:hypothetical protein